MKTELAAFDPLVSFGPNVDLPSQLKTRRTSAVLEDIERGRWQELAEQIRRLPHRTEAQKETLRDTKKKLLPYVTWSGVFNYRNNVRLERHSGLIGIDVDDLTPGRYLKVMTKAVSDPHCFSAFTSVSGRGVRLLFRVTPIPHDHVDHRHAWQQVAQHVRDFYNEEPDKQAKEVSRASFVSYSKLMVRNFEAAPLPIAPVQRMPKPLRKPVARAAVPLYVPERSETNFSLKHFGLFHLGQNCAPTSKKSNGRFYTHRSLFRLGRKIAMLVAKEGWSETEATAAQEKAFNGWKAAAQEDKLTHASDVYWKELREIVRSVSKGAGIAEAAAKWTRWLQHPEFPTNGDSERRLLFAIRQHCKEEQTKVFFIGCRDAAKIAGVKSTQTSARMLKEFTRCKILSVADDKNYVMHRFSPRHAQKYRLLG